MAKLELSDAQATDLARYFLGREWSAYKNLPTGAYVISRHSGGWEMHTSSNWRDVFRAAGVKLPSRPSFTVHGLRVMNNEKAACTAASGTMAKRICNALNAYEPDKKGF